jgi:hypothetical protein
MCCPYFIPDQRHDADLWLWRQRLPLGDAFRGCCSASGHQGERPDDEALRQCNLGYARCAWLPVERAADAVRFCVPRDAPAILRILFAMELNHAPGESGVLEFSRPTSTWLNSHRDKRLQRQAECFLAAYLSRHPARAEVGAEAAGE